jgi:UPF0716 family protein affecting phage T7 exclusion
MNMHKRIALGTALLLTLGTAVAGTLMYGHEPVDTTLQTVESATVAESAPTPEMIAVWKATATSADYVSAKLPI